VELQWKPWNILLLLGNSAAHPHLDSLKNIQLEFFQHRIPDTTNGRGNHKKFEV
jgi:hypothetical protein